MEIAKKLWLMAKNQLEGHHNQILEAKFQSEALDLKQYEMIVNCVASFLKKIQKFKDQHVRLALEDVVYQSVKMNYNQTIEIFFSMTHGKIINFINQNMRIFNT